ncbi:hypothetical protein C5F63_19430 [Photobacterium damselae subsp. damselae]|nr:hypothetical protein BST98_15330 [Photobacterium damselae]PSB78649.1 hypothetical protein C5F61_08200 [Photobacterium damselae subsp. damselae]PSB83317.1 hypothetical protein C5F63_19430 [Photobacterium damselae subsp. damselae]PSW86559.1 hypothetical protein CTN07_05385 [Photobacterium damselae]
MYLDQGVNAETKRVLGRDCRPRKLILSGRHLCGTGGELLVETVGPRPQLKPLPAPGETMFSLTKGVYRK